MAALKPPAAPPGHEAMAARHQELTSVSSRLAEMVAMLRQSREAVASRHADGAASLTPPPMAASGLQVVPPSAAPEPPRAGAGPAQAGAGEALLQDRLETIEQVNRTIRDELLSLQGQMAQAAALYVTLRRLHEAGTRVEVLDGLQESIINMLGSEDFVILIAGPRGGLAAARTMQRSSEQANLVASDPRVQAAIARGALTTGAAASTLMPGLNALIPLVARGRSIGAMAVFQLLQQKEALGAFDEEIMGLLALHGALAWMGAPEKAADGA